MLQDEKNALCDRLSAIKEGSEVDETWLDAMGISLQGMLDHTVAIDSDISNSRAAFDDANVLETRDVPEVLTSGEDGFETSTVLSLHLAVDVSKDMHDHHPDCPTGLLIDGSDLMAMVPALGQPEDAEIAEQQPGSVPAKAEEYDKEDEKGSPTPIDVGLGHDCVADGSTTMPGCSTRDLQDAARCDDDDLDFVPLAITASLPHLRQLHSSDCTSRSSSHSASADPASDSSAVPRIAVLEVESDDDDDFLPLDTIAPPVPVARSTNAEVSELQHRNCDDVKGADEDDNLWLRVGGGLAIVGAIVGGAAAITMLHDNGSKDRKRGTSEEPKPKQ